MAAKQHTMYTCHTCAYESVKWLGHCPSCGEWNTFTEGIAPSKRNVPRTSPSVTLSTLTQPSPTPQTRIESGIREWDRVLGGGIFPGSFTILTGDPGIGKSTLLLQVADNIARHNNVFYFSSEESYQQVASRAQRLGITHEKLLFSDCADLDAIIDIAQRKKPDLIIIDSIQNCFSAHTPVAPGSIGHLREAGFKLMRLAKESQVAVLVTGHITKEGHIAGPKMLEHIVDAVFYLQSEDRWNTRILRAVKNRFGSVNELGFFHMHEHGMREEPNINAYLLREYHTAPGSVLISYLEGSRPLLLDVQALTIPSKFGMPQRVITGADHKHVLLIAAILEKYLNIKLSAHDIFFKVSGGLKIKDHAADLGIALALLSSYFQKALPQKALALGEINLTGLIKPVKQFNIHLQEAISFGIEALIIAPQQQRTIEPYMIVRKHIYELLTLFDD
jgi:DNA repair protein RadA/Sms